MVQIKVSIFVCQQYVLKAVLNKSDQDVFSLQIERKEAFVTASM